MGPIRLTPNRVILALALIGSVVFVVYGLVTRDATQVPLLTTGLAILGIVFVALSLAGASHAYRAGADGHGGRAFALAVGGGLCALVAAGSLASAVILALVWRA